jgi:hypothetical protein
MIASKTAKNDEKSTAASNAASDLKEPTSISKAPGKQLPERKPESKTIELTYRDKQFVTPKKVTVIEGDTLSFTCSTDLENCEMIITLEDKEFFEPFEFIFKASEYKNGVHPAPVKVMKPLVKECPYDCHFSGTRNGKPETYPAQGGGFVVP